MSTAHVEIWLRNSKCDLLKDCWRTDLVIQACTGAYLVEVYPEIIDQLKKRYGKPASVQCTSEFPLSTDQSGKTLSVTVGTGTSEDLVFTSPATSLAEIHAQMKAFFQKVDVNILVDGFLTVISKEHGPDVTLSISGDSDLAWGPIIQGSGWQIKKHFYQNAWRIMIYPGNGETLNHIELEIPPCAYKLWTRVCHGANEETSVAMHKFKGSTCHTVNLLLPTLKTCAAHVAHPLMDYVVHNQALENDDNRVAVLRGVLYGAGMDKQKFIEQLDYRMLEAQEDNNNELEGRIQAVRYLAEILPGCP